MSVYVDYAFIRYRRMLMSHMIADTLDELHAMADKIGVHRRHFQEDASIPHYDICKYKRAIAIDAFGAIPLHRNDFVTEMRRIRQYLADKHFGFAEENEPCGDKGLKWKRNIMFKFSLDRVVDLSDIQAIVIADKPWHLVIWEPLHIPAPGPDCSSPYCCYADTVIFYAIDEDGKKQAVDAGGNLAEHGRVRHRLRVDDVIAFAGTDYEVGCGRVVWRRGGWWMRHPGRRVPTVTLPGEDHAHG